LRKIRWLAGEHGAQLGMDAKNFLALASWCATKGKMHKMEGVFSGEIPLRGSDFPCPIDKKARRMTPIVPVMETHHASWKRGRS
jgi:hypothetical protein